MGLFDKLKALKPDDYPVQDVAEWLKVKHPTLGRMRPAVEPSSELTRILALPKRPPVDLEGSPKAQALVRLMTSRLARHNPDCSCHEFKRPCILELKPAQAWALYEAPLAGGLIGPIGVGHGKTILDILMPLVMPDCRVAVLFIPPGLKDQLQREYVALREHFRVPSLMIGNTGSIVPGAPILHVVPYSKFSRQDSTDLLKRLSPDLIIADEGHKLRHRQTATTSRALRYFVERPETRLCVWSGTLTAKSIEDYAHLAAIALREKSPLPLDPNVTAEWALAIDPSDWPAPSGALGSLCEDGESLYSAFHKRLTHTLGVVATKAGSIGASIEFREKKAPPIPEEVTSAIRQVREGWVRPDGEELIDQLQVAKSARELAAGFYYHWKFPHGEPEELILDWFDKRKAWHRELREKLKPRREHLDSPLLCIRAALRAFADPPYNGPLPVWRSETFKPWLEIRDQVKPESEAVWISDYLARDTADWALKNRGIVWYEATAFGRQVEELTGLPRFAGGEGCAERLAAERGDRSILCSIKALGVGTDGLQRIFSQQLVANPPASGDQWEQLLGRTHRIGQNADETVTYTYRHTSEYTDAIDKAILQARYIESTMGTFQKLLHSSFDWSL